MGMKRNEAAGVRVRGLHLLVLLATLVLAGCSWFQPRKADVHLPVSGNAVASMQSVDATMIDILETTDIPGASLTVARHGKIIYQRGFGWAHREAREAVQPESLFRIASVSKPMTAVAVLKAFEAELPAALDRSVFGPGGLLTGSRYAHIKDARVLKITLRDLLQHTNGWDSDVYEPQYDLVQIAAALKRPAPASAADVVEYMLKFRELQREPGTHFSYSNFGYNILGRVLEQKTGLPYDEAMRRLVFDPIGNQSPRIGGDTLAERRPGEVVYYDDPRWPPVPSQTGRGSGPEAYNGFHFAAMDAHGGWVMTSADMVRFADAIDGRSGVPRLLQPATVALMSTKDPKIPNANGGLGWVVDPSGWNHAGALSTGTHSFLERRTDGLTWAVVYNRLPIDPDNAQASLAETMKTTLKGLHAAILRSQGLAP